MLLLDKLSSWRFWVLLGGGVVLMVLLCYVAVAGMRKAQAFGYSRTLVNPTMASIHQCEMYIAMYLAENDLREMDNPRNCIISIIGGEEGGGAASYDNATGDIKEALFDAWGRPLHFVFDSKYETGYEIRSAGMDGELFTQDDLGNWDGGSGGKLHDVPPERVMKVLFVVTSLLAGVWGYILLKNNDPVVWGGLMAIGATVGAVNYLTPGLSCQRGSGLDMLWGIVVVGGGLAAGLLLRQSKMLPVKLLGCVFIGIPLFVCGMIVYVEFLE